MSVSYPPAQAQPEGPPAPPTDPSRRPGQVTVAVALTATTSALALTVAGLTVIAMAHFNHEFRPNIADAGVTDLTVHQTEIGVRGVLIALAAVAAAAAVVNSLLAIGVQAGNNGARVGTWVLCCLGTLCGVASVAGIVLARSPITAVDPSGAPTLAATIAQAVRASLPGWFGGALGSLCGTLALGYIAVAVLLAVPSARAFFQRIAVPWPAAA